MEDLEKFIKRKEVMQVDYSDLEDVLSEAIGNKVSFTDIDNDRVYQVDAYDEDMDDEEIADIEEELSTGSIPSYNFEKVLSWLCVKYGAPAGEYLISVCY